MNAGDAIVDAVLALLKQAPAVTAGPIGEDVDLATVGETVTEAVSVSLVASDPMSPTVLMGAPVDWITSVQIECYARRDARGAAGRASRALHAKVYARLMAPPQLSAQLAGADVRQPSIRSDQQPLDTRTGTTVGVYPVMHRTQAYTLDNPAT